MCDGKQAILKSQAKRRLRSDWPEQGGIVKAAGMKYYATHFEAKCRG
jgi:hypothetical protein